MSKPVIVEVTRKKPQPTRCEWCGCSDLDVKPNGDHTDCADERERRRRSDEWNKKRPQLIMEYK